MTARGRRAAPQRYQLSKRATAVVASGHPWIFRGLTSSALAAFADGQWLALYDGANQLVGHGVYAVDGAIAIRVVARGPVRPRGRDFAARVDRALARRTALRGETDGFRAIAGESDDLPAVVVEVLGPVVVAQAYAAGFDALARFAALRVARAVGAGGVVVRVPHRRFAAAGGARVVAGVVADTVVLREGPLRLAASPKTGQKSGAFLDLRGLRRWAAAAALTGARVLNLFAYTGMIGRACEHAGAAHITQIDRDADALAFAATHHVGDAARHQLITADVFAWLKDATAVHDLVIVDPPSMTSRMDQVPGVLASYRRLHAAAAARVAPGGRIVVACCTSRVTRAQFRDVAHGALGGRFAFEVELPPEADHPVGFAEADYLKVLVFRDRQAARA